MRVKDAREAALQWILEEARQVPGFQGAFSHGSTNWLPEHAALPATSDLDVMVLLADPNPPPKPGKFRCRGVLLEVSYLACDPFPSLEQVLGQSHMAGSLANAVIFADPSGRLTELQAAVSRDYPRRCWVRKRCEHARDKVLGYLNGWDASAPLHDQVLPWLFAAGVTTHVPLVAGLKNPTVRRRYVAVRELLTEYDRLDSYEMFLEMLGCAPMNREQVQPHVEALAGAFDAAVRVIRTPVPFAADISSHAHPVAIDGSRRMIERGDYREAVFWLAVTASRCQKVLHSDAPVEVQERFSPAYRELLADLGIRSAADLRQRGAQVEDLLPGVCELAEAIMDANPAVVD